MEPEQYGWLTVLKYRHPKYDVPLTYSHQVSVQGCPAEADAIEATTAILNQLVPGAKDIEVDSVKVVWSPDFRKGRSGQWEQRDRQEHDLNPWFAIPGKPAIPLKRIDSWAGHTYYMPKPSK